MASSRRQEKSSSVLERAVGELIQRWPQRPHGVLITILSVDTAADLQSAAVTVSVYPEEQSRTILHNLTRDLPAFRRALQRRVRLRHLPHIRFVAPSQNDAARIDQILSGGE